MTSVYCRPGYPHCRQWNHPARKPLSSLKSLVARMSHDLRIPLAVILANAEFLTQSNLSKNERDEFYEEIRLSIVRMNELISDLLDCSKGSGPFRPAIGNVVETTERAVRMVSVRPAFRRITIHASPRGIRHRMVRCQPSGKSCGQRCSECLRGGFSRVGPRRDHHIGRASLLAN